MKISRNKLVIIIISAFLFLTLVFGLTLGIISAVRNSDAVVEYEGVTMDKGVASFFISQFKSEHIKNLKADGYITACDSPVFWSLKYNDEYTHGEYFKLLCEQRLREIVLENYIFEESGASLSDDDEAIIDKTLSGVLYSEAGGSVEEFDRITADFRFTYADFERAARMSYIRDKKLAYAALYGAGGTGIASDTAFCNEYFSEYSHVKLLFIRLEDKVVTNEDGSTYLSSLSAKEKNERLELVESIKTAISAYESESDGRMTETAFNNLLAKHNDGDTDWNSLGYYFHPDSEANETEMGVRFPELMTKILTMEKNSYAAVEVDMFEERFAENPDEKIPSPAICFIYKYEPTPGDYNAISLERWFSDFYKDAAEKKFSEIMEKYTSDVNLTEKLSEIDFLGIAVNSSIYPKWESLK